MATKGLKYPVFAIYSGGAYSGGAVLGYAMTAAAKYNADSAAVYGDDALRETDKRFLGGTLTVGITGLSVANRMALLGHSASTAPATGFVGAETDEPPYVGFGFYGAASGGIFKAFWYHKVQFAEPSDELATRGEKTEFKTPTLEGALMKDNNGKWIEVQEFSVEGDAIAWLNGKVGLPVSASSGLSALSLTGTGGTLSPSFGAAVRYYTFGGLTGTSFTVTATAASHTIKLYVDGVFSQNLTSGTASAAISMAATGTKKLAIVAYEANKTAQTTEIVVVKTA